MLYILLLLGSTAWATPQTEVHWNVCGSNVYDIVEKLEGTITDDKERTVSYFDSLDRTWQKEEVAFRLRKGKKKSVTTLKVGTSPEKVPAHFYDLEDFSCEYDLRQGDRGFVCSLDHEVDSRLGLQGMMSNEQKQFLKEMGKSTSVPQPKTYGPVYNHRIEIENQRHAYQIEFFQLGQSELVEVSVRVPTSQAAKTLKEEAAELEDVGIHLCQEQMGKLEWVFNHYPKLQLN